MAKREKPLMRLESNRTFNFHGRKYTKGATIRAFHYSGDWLRIKMNGRKWEDYWTYWTVLNMKDNGYITEAA